MDNTIILDSSDSETIILENTPKINVRKSTRRARKDSVIVISDSSDCEIISMSPGTPNQRCFHIVSTTTMKRTFTLARSETLKNNPVPTRPQLRNGVTKSSSPLKSSLMNHFKSTPKNQTMISSKKRSAKLQSKHSSKKTCFSFNRSSKKTCLSSNRSRKKTYLSSNRSRKKQSRSSNRSRKKQSLSSNRSHKKQSLSSNQSRKKRWFYSVRFRKNKQASTKTPTRSSPRLSSMKKISTKAVSNEIRCTSAKTPVRQSPRILAKATTTLTPTNTKQSSKRHVSMSLMNSPKALKRSSSKSLASVSNKTTAKRRAMSTISNTVPINRYVTQNPQSINNLSENSLIPSKNVSNSDDSNRLPTSNHCENSQLINNNQNQPQAQFSCPMVNCKRKFSSSENLYNHIYILGHNSCLPSSMNIFLTHYICPKCRKEFKKDIFFNYLENITCSSCQQIFRNGLNEIIGEIHQCVSSKSGDFLKSDYKCFREFILRSSLHLHMLHARSTPSQKSDNNHLYEILKTHSQRYLLSKESSASSSNFACNNNNNGLLKPSPFGCEQFKPPLILDTRNLDCYREKSEFICKLKQMKHIIFVDLDNWTGLFKRIHHFFPKETFLWVFYGAKTKWYPPNSKIYKKLVQDGCFFLNPKSGSTKQAADFAIVLHIGKMDERLPQHIKFTILSGDKGFYEVSHQFKNSKRLIQIVDPHNFTRQSYNSIFQ